MKREIKLIISDFDGTLVDTREANFLAYRDVLGEIGYMLTAQEYNQCFGLRFEEFMSRINIFDDVVKKKVQINKARIYPSYFNKIKINENLAHFIESFRRNGGKAALASTASRQNLINVLSFAKLHGLFDVIFSAEDITRSKPDPECYRKAMQLFGLEPQECLIFEDSPIGIEAASASGASYIIVREFFYGN